MYDFSRFYDENSDPHPTGVSELAVFPCIAETSIVKAILEGSGGPDNREITEPGLRFIRHLLTRSRSSRFGFVPNFKDMNTVYRVAREFIRCSGGAAPAMQILFQVTQCGEA